MISAATLALSLVVADDAPPKLVIPDQLYLEFSTGAPRKSDECEPPDALTPGEREAYDLREAAEVRVAYADEIQVTGHLERAEGSTLFVLGRRIDSENAEFSGGGRDSLARGTLLRVTGNGTPTGIVRARQVEVISELDPDDRRKLKHEVDKFKTKFWKKAKKLDDPALTEYVTGIVRRLVPEYVPDAERHFEVSIVKDPDLNAFALPDGTVVVNSGLIARLDNEAQLASVLGHEMAHITQLHAERASRKETEQTILNWGALLASIALGVSGKGDAAQGVQLMSSAILSGYSRTHEDEADQVGLRYLYLAGYDVRQAPEVWKTFQLLYGDPTTEANFFYGSHSTGREREHNLTHEIWKSYEPSGLLGGRDGREEYLKATAGAVRENAIVDMERGNLAWADWGIAKSLALAPEDPLTYVALGRITLRKGEGGATAQAIEEFHRALELDRSCAEAWRELGYTLVRSGDRKAAAEAFREYLKLKPQAADADAVKRALERT